MTPEQQARAKERYEKFKSLPPEQQQKIRDKRKNISTEQHNEITA
jgi:hypothetical protein